MFYQQRTTSTLPCFELSYMGFLSEVVYYMENRVWVDTKPVCDDSIFLPGPSWHGTQSTCPHHHQHTASHHEAYGRTACILAASTDTGTPPPPHTSQPLLPFYTMQFHPSEEKRGELYGCTFSRWNVFPYKHHACPPGVGVTAPGYEAADSLSMWSVLIKAVCDSVEIA